MNNDFLEADSKSKGVISTIIEKLTKIEQWTQSHMAVQHKPFPLACRVYNTGNVSIANNTYTAVTFNAERRDDGGFWTVANPTRLTAPITGWYHIQGNSVFTANATGIRIINIQLSGGNYIARQFWTQPTANNPSMNVSTIYYMTAGQYVELVVYQNSGGALNTLNAADYSPEFAIALIK